MSAVEIFLEIFVIGCSLLILSMTVLAYRLAKNKKLILVSGAFALFFVRALLLLLDTFFSFLGKRSSSVYWLGFDLFILILIYSAIVKK